MHHLVGAGKSIFVLASGIATAVTGGGGVHPGITAGQLLAGGGGILLGLSILRGASEVGRVRQIVADHERRIGDIEAKDK